MPISQTTFEQRITRINQGKTETGRANSKRRRRRRSFRERCLTFPFWLGLSILGGGTGYAYVDSQPDIDVRWMVALASLPEKAGL